MTSQPGLPRRLASGRRAACLAALAVFLPAIGPPRASVQPVGIDEARRIAGQAYTFAYPLVLVEMTRRATTLGGAPEAMNRFRHEAAFPDERFREVIRPNADTLYSTAWLDLAREPVLLHVPDAAGRFYVMQIVDAWGDTVASPGKRTTGTGEGWFAIIGPGWKGELPPNVRAIQCPTATASVIGRTQTNGPGDYDAVHAVQRGYLLGPLSTYPKGLPPLPAPDPARMPAGERIPPPVQVQRMSSAEFFGLFAQLLARNPARAEDKPLVTQMARIGIVAGQPFPASKSSPEQTQAVDAGAHDAASALSAFDLRSLPIGTSGWTLPARTGRYGTDYAARARTARYFLGILPGEDAVYLSCARDRAGRDLDGSRRYTIHFDKAGLPPVRAFWSVTLYDAQGYFTANSLHRVALGDRDALKFNADGSLDLYVQRDSPGPDKESNWLPAPAGSFNLALRMYWPGAAAANGEWTPPPVVQR